MRKRKICFVVTSHIHYTRNKLVLDALRDHPRVELQIVVGGSAILPKYGEVLDLMQKDGFKCSAKITMVFEGGSPIAMAKTTGIGITEFATVFDNLNPDVVIVRGDRYEVLSAAIAASYLNIPVAHIEGGDVTGTIDESVRHAITKLAHIHFPATQKARERILRLGEEPWRVMVAGAPALDRILNDQVMPKQTLLKKYRLDPRQPLGLLVQHPVHSQIKEAGKQIQSTLQAIVDLKLQTVVVYPNADAGGRAMIKVLGKFKKYLFLKHYKSIPHADYLGLLKIASVLIGNSSSGIIEAASFRLPVINIGCRQEGRERSVNVIDVPHEKRIIARVIQKVIHDQKFRRRVKQCRNPYGDGKASGRIVKFLGKVNLNNRLIQKKITY